MMGLREFFGMGKLSTRSKTRSLDEIVALLDGAGWGGVVMAGEAVTLQTALRVSAVLACAKVIADGCATPQLRVYRERANGARELAANIPEQRLLARRPNEWQTSFEFRRTMTMHAVLCGDALAVKVMGDNKRVGELIPVQPGNFQIEERGRHNFVYRCWDKWGLIKEFGPAQVLHLPNLRWELVKSMDALSLAREAVGLSIATERTQATLHANGGRPAGVLTTPNKLSVEVIERLKASWREFTTTNKNGTAILDNGFDYKPMAMSGVDQQHLEQRRFQVEEVARAFGVFPIMIGHSDKTATYASAEAMFAAHERHTLAPWLELWRQRLDEFILDGEGPLYVEFDTRYLTQGSMKDRAEWARTMIEMQIMTRNEIRDAFGMDAVDGGNEFWSPANIAGGDSGGGGDAASVDGGDPPSEGSQDD